MSISIDIMVVLLGVLFGLAGAFAQGAIGGTMPTDRQIAKATGRWSLVLLVVSTASIAFSKTPATPEAILSWLPLMGGVYGALFAYAVGLLIAKRL